MKIAKTITIALLVGSLMMSGFLLATIFINGEININRKLEVLIGLVFFLSGISSVAFLLAFSPLLKHNHDELQELIEKQKNKIDETLIFLDSLRDLALTKTGFTSEEIDNNFEKFKKKRNFKEYKKP